jgi:hypothetical protein
MRHLVWQGEEGVFQDKRLHLYLETALEALLHQLLSKNVPQEVANHLARIGKCLFFIQVLVIVAFMLEGHP